MFDKTECVHIACAINDDYALPLAIMLRSLEDNLSVGGCVSVNILFESLCEASRGIIRNSLRNIIQINWVRIDARRVNGLKLSHHITKETYFRLLLDSLFPELDKIIYLDADIIVNRDIADLWRIPHEGKVLLAARQISPDGSRASSKFGIRNFAEIDMPANSLLFNAGVLSINLSKWRRLEISTQILNYLKLYHTDIIWWDQDGLNAILWNDWTEIDYRWNTSISLFKYFDTSLKSPFDQQVFEEIRANPFVVHYNSSIKPWQKGYSLAFKELFYKYLNEAGCALPD